MDRRVGVNAEAPIVLVSFLGQTFTWEYFQRQKQIVSIVKHVIYVQSHVDVKIELETYFINIKTGILVDM